MHRFLKALWSDEAGQDATEYVLLIVLIALLVAVGMVALAGGLNNIFSDVGDELSNVDVSLPGGGDTEG